MSYREQIEKIAVNAQKARAMAKEVGLLPIGNWKYGLRNMRNMHTGDLLQGRELAMAKTKLGLSSNNAYQKIKSMSRKLPSKTETAGILDRKSGKLLDSAIGDINTGTIKNNINGKSINLHTHPGHPGEDRFGILGRTGKQISGRNTLHHVELSNIDENIKRIVNPRYEEDAAIGKSMKDIFKPKRNPLLADAGGGMTYLDGYQNHGSKLTANNNTRRTINNELNKFNKTKDYSHKNSALDLASKKYNIDMEYSIQRPKHGMPEGQGDMSEFTWNNIEGKGGKQNIITPDQNYEAIHRVSPYKKTSLFFDRNPKKRR